MKLYGVENLVGTASAEVMARALLAHAKSSNEYRFEKVVKNDSDGRNPVVFVYVCKVSSETDHPFLIFNEGEFLVIREVAELTDAFVDAVYQAVLKIKPEFEVEVTRDFLLLSAREFKTDASREREEQPTEEITAVQPVVGCGVPASTAPPSIVSREDAPTVQRRTVP